MSKSLNVQSVPLNTCLLETSEPEVKPCPVPPGGVLERPVEPPTVCTPCGALQTPSMALHAQPGKVLQRRHVGPTFWIGTPCGIDNA